MGSSNEYNKEESKEPDYGEGIVIGFSDMLSIAQTIGIVGTMVLTLIFSKRHIQSLSSHQQTRVLNDLDGRDYN
ncbi:MAG: hypothetical protein ACJ72V_01860 [Nitrososphaeraceae archaeon]